MNISRYDLLINNFITQLKTKYNKGNEILSTTQAKEQEICKFANAILRSENIKSLRVHTTFFQRLINWVTRDERHEIYISVGGAQQKFVVSKSALFNFHFSDDLICAQNPIKNSKVILTQKNELITPRKQFENFYEKHFLNLKELALDSQELKAAIDDLLAASNEFEFNPPDDEIMDYLKKINDQMAANKENPSINLKLVKQVINDLILYHSLTPVKISGTKTHFQRQSAEVVSLHMILSKILSTQSLNLDTYGPFQFIPLNNYHQYSPSQKYFVFNLAILDNWTKQKIVENELFKKFFSSDSFSKSLDWIFACSGGLEQYYLNTCEGASFCQDFTSKVISLPQIVIMTEIALENIKQIEDYIKEPKLKQYFEKRIERESQKLKLLKEKIFSAIKENWSADEIRKLTLEWNDIVQRLGLLTNTHDLGHPTKKIISNHWLLSVILMIPVVLTQHLIGAFINYTKNPPSILMRLTGTRFGSLDNAFRNYGIVYNFEKVKKYCSALQELTLQKNIDKANQQEVLSNAWKVIHDNSGIICHMTRHGFHVKAVKYNHENVFLVGDPKQSDYKVMSFNEFFVFFKKNKCVFDF